MEFFGRFRKPAKAEVAAAALVGALGANVAEGADVQQAPLEKPAVVRMQPLAPEPLQAPLAAEKKVEAAKLAPEPRAARLAPEPQAAKLAPEPERAKLAPEPKAAPLTDFKL